MKSTLNKIAEIMSLKTDGDSASVAWSEGGGGMVYYFKGQYSTVPYSRIDLYPSHIFELG